MKKLSPWFKSKVDLPEHTGIYQVFDASIGLNGYSYWDGEKFGFRIYSMVATGQVAINMAFRYRNDFTIHKQPIKWRGLTK